MKDHFFPSAQSSLSDKRYGILCRIRVAATALLFIAIGLLQAPAWAYTTQAGKILDDRGNIVTLRGVNWFGFETANHIPHGLWTRNWRSMISQMQTLGFNAVRLPFCPDTLRGAVNSVDYAQNPDLNGLNALAALDLIMKGFNDAGMYVLLDHHRPDCNAISELWYTPSYSEQDWIKDLVFVANRYKQLPHFLGIDLKNEPHGPATWGAGNAATDWNRAAERAATAILAANSRLLIFVEGVQENPACSSATNHWWGGNLEPIACTPLKIPADKLVLSPHVYGPDVFNQPYFNDPNFPHNLPAIWDRHFGFVIAAGYSVVIGEFGGHYAHGGDAKDKIWQDAIVDYLISKGVSSAFYWSWNPNSGDTGGILQDDWQTPWADKVTLLQRLWKTTGGPVVAPPACSDGIDNDGDGLIDYPADPGCESATDNNESNSDPVSAQLSTQVVVKDDFGSGYCADVRIHNSGAGAVDWLVTVPVDGSVTNVWNAKGTQSGTTLQAEGLDWNNLVPGNADVSFGFCASRKTAPPVSGSPAGGQVSTRVVINNDWGTGYCAEVTVSNSSDTPTNWRVTFNVVGKVSQAWNAKVSQSGATVIAEGVDWNKLVPAHGSTGFGFCANR
jgi:endoglucanase